MNMHGFRFCRMSFFAFFYFALTGCAGVNFYSDVGLKTKTGIPIYAPKPYLLVARTGAKDKPVDISIIYLTDTKKVIYAEPKSGFGSSNLTLALANGQMTSFGQQTDTKIPELITALGGAVTSYAGLVKAKAEANSLDKETEQAADSPTVTAEKVEKIVADIASKAANISILSATEKVTISSVGQALTNAAKELKNKPGDTQSVNQNIEILKVQAKRLSDLDKPSGTSTARDLALQIVQKWAVELNKIFESSQPEKPALPTFELYEINDTGLKLWAVIP